MNQHGVLFSLIEPGFYAGYYSAQNGNALEGRVLEKKWGFGAATVTVMDAFGSVTTVPFESVFALRPGVY